MDFIKIVYFGKVLDRAEHIPRDLVCCKGRSKLLYISHLFEILTVLCHDNKYILSVEPAGVAGRRAHCQPHP